MTKSESIQKEMAKRIMPEDTPRFIYSTCAERTVLMSL